MKSVEGRKEREKGERNKRERPSAIWWSEKSEVLARTKCSLEEEISEWTSKREEKKRERGRENCER